MQTKTEDEHANSVQRAEELLASKDEFTRSEVYELIRCGRLQGETPQPTRYDERGVPYWSREDFTAWAAKAPQIRSTLLAEQTRVAERGEVRSKTWNPADRTFTAVAASDQPVTMIDWREGGVVNEILVADGGHFEPQTPLHVDHNTAVDRLVGIATNPRREGTFWLVQCRLDDDPYSVGIGSKVASGSLRALSIGYRIFAYEIVRPGTSAVIGGRQYRVAQDEHPLRVVTDWRVHEISLVSIGADSNALIRAASPFAQGNQTMPAIHSRNSITAKPRVGAFVAATLMERGFSDPTQHRYTLTLNGPRRLAPSIDLEKDAEEASALLHRDPLDRLRRCLELDGIYAIDASDVIGRAYQLMLRSFSTSNVAAMYNDEFVSLLYARYDAAGDSTRGWCAENDLLKLKATPRPRLGGVELKIQNPQTGANHLEFYATSEDARLACYSGQFVLDEQDILDGSWGERASAAALQIADGAKALRPNLVYSYLFSNPDMADGDPLFHANHGNLNATAPLGTAGKLAASLAGIGKQKVGNVNLNLRGEYLITPVALQGAAAGAIQTLELIDSESTQPPKLRTDSRLDNGLVDPTDGTGDTVHAGDATTWFTSTAGQYGLEVQYLAGMNRAPQFRSGPLTRGSFGMWFDIRHFIGVAAVGYQGISKNVAT
jgi:hypothetical protein